MLTSLNGEAYATIRDAYTHRQLEASLEEKEIEEGVPLRVSFKAQNRQTVPVRMCVEEILETIRECQAARSSNGRYEQE